MNWRIALLLSIWLVLLCGTIACAQDLITNGSFESGNTGWALSTSYTIQVKSNWSGVSPADGSKLLAVSGPVSVGYSYAQLATQSKLAPFVTGVPSDNFVVYLSAQTYLHTTDGRNISYALILEPGYGAMTSSFHGGKQNAWVSAQANGYYYAKNPYDSAATSKPLKVILELRDSLNTGEYLLLDDVHLYYGGPGAEL